MALTIFDQIKIKKNCNLTLAVEKPHFLRGESSLINRPWFPWQTVEFPEEKHDFCDSYSSASNALGP